MTSESLWNYYRYQINDDENDNANNRINNNKTITSKSFEYRTKLIGSTPNNNNILNAAYCRSINPNNAGLFEGSFFCGVTI